MRYRLRGKVGGERISRVGHSQHDSLVRLLSLSRPITFQIHPVAICTVGTLLPAANFLDSTLIARCFFFPGSSWSPVTRCSFAAKSRGWMEGAMCIPRWSLVFGESCVPHFMFSQPLHEGAGCSGCGQRWRCGRDFQGRVYLIGAIPRSLFV